MSDIAFILSIVCSDDDNCRRYFLEHLSRCLGLDDRGESMTEITR